MLLPSKILRLRPRQWPAAAGPRRQPGHHAHEGLAVGEPRLGPAQVLVDDSWHPTGGDTGVFRLAHLISDLSPSPSLLSAHGFHIGNEGGAGPGLEQHMGSDGGGDSGGDGDGVGAGGG
jgi:hypothetical protein